MQDSNLASPANPPPRRRWLGIALGAVAFFLVLLAIGAYLLKGQRYVIELTEAEIQAKLDERFPMEKEYLLILVVRLSEPKVKLVEGSDRITFGISVAVDLKLPGQDKPLGGSGTIATGLRYSPDDFSFYLDDPRLEELIVQGLPVKYVDHVNTVAEHLARERINQVRVYTLDKPDLKQAAARLVLRECTVNNGKLRITLGL